MKTITTISISEARKRIFDIAEEVQKPDVYYTFTEKGKPKAVMLSADEFEGLQETLEVLKDFPNLDKTITELNRDIKSGAYKKYVSLEEILAKDGFVKKNKVYALQGSAKTRRSKKSK